MSGVRGSRTKAHGPTRLAGEEIFRVLRLSLQGPRTRSISTSGEIELDMKRQTTLRIIQASVALPCISSLEKYLEGTGYEDLTEIGREAKPMAQKIIEVGLAPMEEIWGSEVTLYYPDLYAGSTDLVGMYNGRQTLIDFKQSNRPKQREWVTDYFLQVGAYCMAHDYLYDTRIDQAIIMICTPDCYYQEYKVEGLNLRQHKYDFMERMDKYYDQSHKQPVL